MTNFDNNLDFINEVYRNAHVALQAINDVIDSVDDERLKSEIMSEKVGYDRFIGDIRAYMQKMNYEPKELGVMKKVMMKTGIKMNTMMDSSESNIAQIMIKGTVMGITELCTLINQASESIDDECIDFAKRLKQLEENYEQNLKAYL